MTLRLTAPTFSHKGVGTSANEQLKKASVMARKIGTSVEKIKDFTSLADHDAGTLRRAM